MIPDWNKYELFCVDYLLNQEKYHYVWRWSDIPEQELLNSNLISSFEYLRLKRKQKKLNNNNTLRDLGIDILAKGPNGYLIVQVKYYKESTICIEDLAGFFRYGWIKNLSQHQFRVMYDGKLSQPLYEEISDKRYIDNLTFQLLKMDNTDIQVMQITDSDNSSLVISKDNQIDRIILRDYQLEAIKSLNEHFVKNDDIRISGILSMPGGTGKTVIFGKFASLNFKFCVIFSPTRALAEQNLNKVSQFYPPQSIALLIDSDGCRNIEKINFNIQKARQQNLPLIISLTFHSCDVFKLISHNLPEKETLCIVDEFHNIPGKVFIDENHLLRQSLLLAKRVLFVSATPRFYTFDSTTVISNNICGEIIFKLPFQVAIERKYICDYKVWLPTIWEEREALERYKVATNFMNNLDITTERRYLKMLVLSDWMLRLGLKRVIVYVVPSTDNENGDRTAENECLAMIKIFDQIAKEYQYIETNLNTILGTTSQIKRNEILNNFERSDSTFNIIFNCRVLDEGIDIPSCDGIFISSESTNKIRNIQRIYRSLRPHGQKEFGHCLYWSNNENSVLNFLSSISEIDEHILSKIKLESLSKTMCDIKDCSFGVKISNYITQSRPYSDTSSDQNELINEIDSKNIDCCFEKQSFICDKCNKQFIKQWCLDRHLKDRKNSCDVYICKICNVNLKNAKSFKKHKKEDDCRKPEENEPQVLDSTDITTVTVSEFFNNREYFDFQLEMARAEAQRVTALAEISKNEAMIISKKN